MILTAQDYARFDHLDAASRWQVIEDYRTASPRSPAGRRRAVEDLLEQLCLQVHGALWAPGFDAQAWAMLHHADHSQSGQQPCPAHGQDASWQALAALSTAAGWWPIFDRCEPDPFTLGRVATLAQASTAYPPLGRCQSCHHRGQAGASGGRARLRRATVVIDIADPAPRGALTPG